MRVQYLRFEGVLEAAGRSLRLWCTTTRRSLVIHGSLDAEVAE